MLLKALNGGEKLENHQEDKNEADEDDGVDIALDTDEIRDIVADMRKNSDSRHAAPDDESDTEFDKSLTAFVFEVFLPALPDHEASEYEYGYLIGMESDDAHMFAMNYLTR